MLGIKTTVIVVMLFAALLALLLGYQYFAQKLGINPQSAAQSPVINEETVMEYNRICGTLMDCVRHNYRHFGLDVPGDLVEHLIVPQDGIRTKDGQMFFIYQFRRGQDAISIMEHRTTYNTTPAAEIAHRINQELPRYCIANGTVIAKIYKAIDGSDGAIRFVVGAWR